MIPILYLSHCGSSIGGGEKQLAYLLTGIDRERYQPLVVCPDDGVFVEHLRRADIPTVVLPLPPWRRATSLITRSRAAGKLVELAERRNVLLAHTSDSWFNPYLGAVRRHLKIPVISHVRNLLTPVQVRKYGFNGMDRIISISEQSRVPLIRAGIDPQKIDIIHNCVDLSAFRPASEVAHAGRFVVGIVGRIEPFKRQKTFVEIAGRVAARCQRVRFQIIGAALDAREHRSYEQAVREAVAASGLAEIVHFAGHRTDMPAAMQGLDVLVTLSAGSVIAEAMAAGIPVMGTPVGSTAEMIVQGVTGYVTVGDPVVEIADKIVELAENRCRRVAMGKRARAYAERVFGIETHVRQVQAVYERLLTGG